MAKAFWTLGCIFAFLGVAGGAFGAHALRELLPQSLLAIFETGVRYQMYHSLALLLAAGALDRGSGRAARLAGWMFIAGILLFSGSLYLLATTGVLWLGAVTPLGGLAFLIGWCALAVAGWTGSARPHQRVGSQ
jgi:uncharacterized membrane protein YgdD (TMEM256/DUF423 family)